MIKLESNYREEISETVIPPLKLIYFQLHIYVKYKIYIIYSYIKYEMYESVYTCTQNYHITFTVLYHHF